VFEGYTCPMQQEWPLVVVGSGAAGSMAAITAARAGVRVLVLETRKSMGAKIRVSGGGRCNVLPSVAQASDFHTSGSLFTVRNMLASWPLEHVRAFFENDLNIPLKTEDTGKVFPVSDDARDVVDGLHAAMLRAGVAVRFDAKVADVKPGFEVTLVCGEVLRARRVVLATGGLSMPKTGSEGAGWRWARAMGHSVVHTYPALVPLLTEDPTWHVLAGVSLPVRMAVRANKVEVASYEGDFLFTHKGFSGPVVLNASKHFACEEGVFQCEVSWGNMSPEQWHVFLCAHTRGLLEPVLREKLPKRLVEVLLEKAGVSSEQPMATLSKAQRTVLVEQLTRTVLCISGTEGYKTAEVTAGGIPLNEVSSKTLESKKIPGLFFAGEMLDVTGRLGGYNFLWAWVSGKLVGQAVSM
jgi:predicted Rossmann fold flavoprotein